MANVDIMKLDLYNILGVTEESSLKEIVKAFRKQALKCHPDKNPDNPKAAELFHQLTKALEVLTDAAAKAAYDKIRKAKKAAQIRHKQLDSKRKKFKEDLESRENAAASEKASEASAKANFAAEVERLRKEGSKLLEEEQGRLRQQLKEEAMKRVQPDREDEPETAKLKLKWKVKKDDDTNGGYTRDSLMELFSKYGKVINLLVSAKRKGSAIVEFTSAYDADEAASAETGLPINPLTITWLSQPPVAAPQADLHIPPTPAADINFPSHATEPGGHDYESITLMRMRQAQERQKIIEQMMKEDADDT